MNNGLIANNAVAVTDAMITDAINAAQAFADKKNKWGFTAWDVIGELGRVAAQTGGAVYNVKPQVERALGALDDACKVTVLIPASGSMMRYKLDA